MDTTCHACTHPVSQHAGLAGCLNDDAGNYCTCTLSPTASATTPSPRDQAADLAKGRALAEQGTTRVLNADAVTDWRERAYTWIDTQAARGHAMTSTELVDAIGMAPSPNAVGAVFRAKAAQRVIVGQGYVQSTRPSCHGAVVRVWVAA